MAWNFTASPYGGSFSDAAKLNLMDSYPSFGSETNYWDSAKNLDLNISSLFGGGSNSGGSSSGNSINPFANAFKSGFGSMGAPTASSLNMPAMLAASAGIASARDSAERQLDYKYGLLASEVQNKQNMDKWYKFGPYLTQQEQNLAQRGDISNNVMARANEDIYTRKSRMPGYGIANALGSLLPTTRLM